jgi:hypothetical protein
MNIYSLTFKAKCPNDTAEIEYELTLHSDKMIMVESILEECANHKEGFQEDIAAAIRKHLGCGVIMKAVHQNVTVETRLGFV